MLYLYLLTPINPTVRGSYYDGVVVAARSGKDALTIPPNPGAVVLGLWPSDGSGITYTFLGDASPHMRRGVVLASFIRV